MEYQLYKLSKTGKVLSFHILVDTSPTNACIITQKGFMDGAKQTDRKEFEEGKNIGRANETTPQEQALAEAKSQYLKLLDKGYKLWGYESNPIYLAVYDFLIKQGVGTDASGKLKVMLAAKNIEAIEFPCWGNYKYDGVRCFSFLEDGGIEKVSRNGKPFIHLDHLDAQLLAVFGDNCIVDGELYSHAISFQKNVSAIKRKQANNKIIGLRIYDIIPSDNHKMIQDDRWKLLKQARKKIRAMKADGYQILLEIAPYFYIGNMEDALALHEKAVKLGYEGAIFRLMDGVYHFGHRSNALMKLKEMEEEEFEIIGAEEATGRDIGTAVMLVRVSKTIVAKARPLGDRAYRRSLLININKHIGKMATIIFQGYTDDGSLRFPRMKSIRDYE